MSETGYGKGRFLLVNWEFSKILSIPVYSITSVLPLLS